MNSKEMKAYLLYYYRYNRHMLCATEVCVARGIADVLAISKDISKSIEIEIKVSLSDLKADFVNKERKHMFVKENTYDRVPNYMVFAVPEKLVEKALVICPKEYGVCCVHDNGEIKFFRNAKRLNNTDNKKLCYITYMRCSSELATLYNRFFTKV